jgi:predicted RNase H-like HicB family nuclease
MNYMVVHEELKRGGWRTIVPDMPLIDATGARFETRRKSAELNIKKYLTTLMKADKQLPKDVKKVVRMKRTVKRCYVHFVSFSASDKHLSLEVAQ